MAKSFLHSIKSSLRDGIKATSGIFASGSGGSGYIGNGVGGGYMNTGLFRRSPGSSINWDAVTGGISDNPIAYTCLTIIQDNFCQAVCRVERKEDSDGKFVPAPEHPATKLLMRPNPFYSFEYLTKGILASMHGQSDAYVGIERDAHGLPSELYWLPSGVSPIKDPGSRNLVDAWWYDNGKTRTRVAKEDIIHIPFGANPARPGFGLSGWQALKQDQYILQQGGNYTANVMRNNGTIGVLLSPKAYKDSNGNEIRVDADPKEITDLWAAKTRGDRAGEATYLDFPMDVVFPNNTPQNLALDTILDRPESNICAVFRVSILLVGAYGGRFAKTYANGEQAVQSLWEECILPLESDVSGPLTTQLLPQFGSDPTRERIAYDNSEIRALQPDLNDLHERVRNDFKANLIDLYTAEVETNRVPEESHKGLYFYQLPSVSDKGQVPGGVLASGQSDGTQETQFTEDGPTPGTGKKPPPLAIVAGKK